MGLKIGQISLRFGCNDFGSLMIEENVVSAANTTHRTSIEELDRLIRDAGFTPARRRQDYSIIAPPAPPASPPTRPELQVASAPAAA
jgi:cyclic dehypoxanthinyl futalosine synthase